MPPASVCVFNLRASCGLPSFAPNDTQSPDIDISYVQFDDTDAQPVTPPLSDITFLAKQASPSFDFTSMFRTLAKNKTIEDNSNKDHHKHNETTNTSSTKASN